METTILSAITPILIEKITGTSPALVTTKSAHGYSTGNMVAISGNTEGFFNGIFSITNVSTTSFTLVRLDTSASFDGLKKEGIGGYSVLLKSALPVNVSGSDVAIIKVTTSGTTDVEFDFYGSVEDGNFFQNDFNIQISNKLKLSSVVTSFQFDVNVEDVKYFIPVLSRWTSGAITLTVTTQKVLPDVMSVPPLEYWNGSYTQKIKEAINNVFSIPMMGTYPSHHVGVAHGESAVTYTSFFQFGCLLPNGRVFMGTSPSHPLGANIFGLYDPKTNTYTRAGGGLDSNGNYASGGSTTVNWDAAAIGVGSMTYVSSRSSTYPDGLVVIIAYSGTTFKPLRYNPATNLFVASSVADASNLYGGSSPLPDGKVLFSPYSTGPIGIYDPVADTISTLTNPAGNGCEGAQLLPNGKVLMCPRSSSGLATLYDSVTGTASVAGGGYVFGGSHGTVLTKNGKVVICPTSATGALTIYNWETDTFSTGMTLATGGSSVALGNGHIMPDGQILFTQRTSTNSVLYNPETNTAIYIPGASSGSNYYLGSAVAENGKVVLVPNTGSTTIDWIDVHGSTTNDLYTRLHPVWNKF